MEVRLRGHHLLCLHGFRGLGYSEGFVANMQAIRSLILESPQIPIEVIDTPDSICEYCPHCSSNGCSKNGSESEALIGSKDRTVLEKLSLKAGDRITACNVFAQTSRVFKGALDSICESCHWRKYGWCSEGIDQCSMISGTR